MNEYWSSLASLLGALAFLQTLIPPHLRHLLSSLLRRLLSSLTSLNNNTCLFDIPEFEGVTTNELYSASTLYLSSSSLSSSRRLSIASNSSSTSFTFSLSNHNHCLRDTFRGSVFDWSHNVLPRTTPSTFSFRPLPDDKRSFTLSFTCKTRNIDFTDYLQHIMDTAAEIRRTNQDRLLYTNARGMDSCRAQPWESVPFKHPSTFDTLAMDPEYKSRVMKDLNEFANGEKFYGRTGRAWKRGYLLYGPPGTGKSSMIAAMANYLKYDIYDLELTEVSNNSELRKLLMKTSTKSIIVIEDIDCSVNLTMMTSRSKMVVKSSHREEGSSTSSSSSTMTLSGLLNFTDGLWSCCGSERIFVFTTNHVERLDPALLRSGRMDMHIYMGHCLFPALRILMRNYLGVEEEEEKGGLMRELEEVVEEAEITPADVSEVLIKNRRFEKDKAMRELLNVLKGRVEVKKMKREEKKRNVERGEEEEEEEEEEQEKRTLESPKRDVMESCIDGEEGEELGKEGKE